MGRFKKKDKGDVPAISTASLPDIVFMLLFFFMVTTQMRTTEIFVKQSLPMASEVQKLEKKAAVSYIFVGIPHKTAIYGTEPRIQLNDQIADLKDIQSFITSEREATPEYDRPFLTTSLKVDKETKMGVVSDIKQELRKIGAFKINYSSRKDHERLIKDGRE